MFELNINCTKDIDELHINFSDGSVSAVTKSDASNGKQVAKRKDSKRNQQTEPEKQKERQTNKQQDDLLDLDGEWGNISQDVVELPEIKREERPVKVADELQNFDF